MAAYGNLGVRLAAINDLTLEDSFTPKWSAKGTSILVGRSRI
jgi:hypothetical protein